MKELCLCLSALKEVKVYVWLYDCSQRLKSTLLKNNSRRPVLASMIIQLILANWGKQQSWPASQEMALFLEILTHCAVGLSLICLDCCCSSCWLPTSGVDVSSVEAEVTGAVVLLEYPASFGLASITALVLTSTHGWLPNRSANLSRKMSSGETIIREGVEAPLVSKSASSPAFPQWAKNYKNSIGILEMHKNFQKSCSILFAAVDDGCWVDITILLEDIQTSSRMENTP